MENEQKTTEIEKKVMLLEKAKKQFKLSGRIIFFIACLVVFNMTLEIVVSKPITEGSGIAFFILITLSILIVQINNIIDIISYLFKEIKDIV